MSAVNISDMNSGHVVRSLFCDAESRVSVLNPKSFV